MTSTLIVILNWNGIEDTENCIDSLLKQSYENFHILIVDNDSHDDSVPRLRLIAEKNSEVTLIENQVNSGFSGGVNIGIKYGMQNNFDTIALFNNDAVADKDWLKNLVHSIEKNNKLGIATGLLLDESGDTIDSAGEQYSIWGTPFSRGRNEKQLAAPASGLVFGATGGASLYKTKMLSEIGLFDEVFFAYYEDVDISYRAQLAGWKVTYESRAVAYHKRGATSNKIPGFTIYQNFKNLPLLFWKNTPSKLLLKVGVRFTLLYLLTFINAIKKGSGLPALKGVVASIWYFWVNALWRRFRIQRSRKVSKDYIWSVLYPDLPPTQAGMRKLRKLVTGK